MKDARPDFKNPSHVVLSLIVIWCGFFAALETARTVKTYANQPWTDDRPSQWRPGAEPVKRLEQFLSAIAGELPPGARVAFSTSHGSEARIAARWAAFFLPEHEVFAAGPEALDGAEYWLFYGPPERAPEVNASAAGQRSQTLASSPAGALYRLGGDSP